MNENVAKLIEARLEKFLQELVEKYDNTDKWITKSKLQSGEYKPFHMALIPIDLLKIQSFFRHFSTSLGKGVFEYIAKIIASSNDKWTNVELNKKFNVYNAKNIQSTIATFIDKIQSKKKEPYPYPKFPNPNSKLERNIVVDLSFMEKTHGTLYLIEIKSPKPNKDQLRQTKEKFLYLQAKYPDSKIYLAFPYNPYGEEKDNYNWGFTKMFFDINNEVLIGDEFWDLLGGKNTYSEILRIFKIVGKRKGKEITKKIIKMA